jgi:hypothetical protein
MPRSRSNKKESKECDFISWYYKQPQYLLNLEKLLSPANALQVNTVNYVVDYNYTDSQSSPTVLKLNTTPLLGSAKDNLTLTVQENIYDARNYCVTPTKIGLSYYTVTLFAQDSTYTVFQGPYEATNIFTIGDITYTIYKSGILQQTLSGAYNGTNYLLTGPSGVYPTSVSIVTENVTGINIDTPNGNFISDVVNINNISGICNSISYTEYSISYANGSIRERKKPPPPPPPRLN